MANRLQLDALVLCASELESRGFVDLFRRAQVLRGHRFGLVSGYIGELHVGVLTFDIAVRKVLDAAAAAVFTVHQPSVVAIAQLAIPLTPSICADSLFATREIIVEQEGQVFRTTVGERDVALETHSPVLSVREWPLRVRTRGELLERTGAVAAAWRSHTIARAVCGHRGVDVAVFRPIVRADVPLPPEALAVYGRGPSFRMGATLGAILQGVDRIKTVRRLRHEATRYTHELGRGTIDLIVRLLERSGSP